MIAGRCSKANEKHSKNVQYADARRDEVLKA